jgi:hypothetical protein
LSLSGEGFIEPPSFCERHRRGITVNDARTNPAICDVWIAHPYPPIRRGLPRLLSSHGSPPIEPTAFVMNEDVI